MNQKSYIPFICTPRISREKYFNGMTRIEKNNELFMKRHGLDGNYARKDSAMINMNGSIMNYDFGRN